MTHIYDVSTVQYLTTVERKKSRHIPILKATDQMEKVINDIRFHRHAAFGNKTIEWLQI